MKDVGFFVAFFAIIILLALSTSPDGENGGLFTRGTTTDEVTEDDGEDFSYPYDTYTQGGGTVAPPTYQAAPPPPPPPALTPAQVEDKVASMYRDLDRLKEDIRIATLSSPQSPYKDKVMLSTGNVYDEDPDREYLTLSVNSSATSSFNISHWYIRSYVTDEVALIPNGDRFLENWRNSKDDPIVLKPGEMAYLITGESPVDGSFKENMCTGYLADEEDFFPSLVRSCPYPREEMKRFGTNIDLDDDKCYTFIEGLSSCTEPEEETYTRGKVESSCRNFIENTFNYRDCVRLHRYDPYFSQNGYWHIYLDERSELWRPRREIIQLMDEQDRVVDVVEY